MTSAVSGRNSIKTKITLTMLAIFLLGLWSLSFYAIQMLRKDMEQLLSEQQLATVSVVADSIKGEINERIRTLELVAHAIDAPMLEKPEELKKFLHQLIVLQAIFNAGMHVSGADGKAVTAEPSFNADNSADQEAVQSVLEQGKSVIGRPLLDPQLKQAVFSVTVPIFGPHGRILGTLTGGTNLEKSNFLDKISNGVYGKTGGYMIVAQKYRTVVTASDARRNMEILPPPGSQPLIDRFVNGYEGTGVIGNRAGVEVLVSAKTIPLAAWYVAASLPTAEAFSPIKDMQERMILATLILTLLAGGLTWRMLQNQLAPMLAAVKELASMSEHKQPLQALPISRQDEIGQLIGSFNRLLKILAQREEALKRSERKLSDILENADILIYLKDLEGRYLFANRPMRAMYAEPIENIVGYTDDKFFSAETVARLRQNDRLVCEQGRTIKAEENTVDLKNAVSSSFLSVKFPLRDENGAIYALCGISTDITERHRAEEQLRIAAIAFECQEGILVLDEHFNILRTNLAFSQITGYTQEQAMGESITLLKSDLQDDAFYAAGKHELQRTGTWQGEMWLRNQCGQVYFASSTITAVTNGKGQVRHYVCNLADSTNQKLQEEQRLRNELAHRDILVREVHHRIKNNLQGITGILRQFAQKFPETTNPINQAIGHVQSISVIHGLQGQAMTSLVRLCELTQAIAREIQNLWYTPVTVQLERQWLPCVIAENEAVPLALILNEIILNAVKHGGQLHGMVSITLHKGVRPDIVQIRIRNAGQLDAGYLMKGAPHNGLQLVAALMPRDGASLLRTQQDGLVYTTLELESPVISPEKKASYD